MNSVRHQLIRSLFDEYIEMYAARDDRLTEHFSENFSGFTGGGDFLVNNREDWIAITRQDFAQISERLRIEMLDISLQDIADDVVIVTAFFHIHLPFNDAILSNETARLVLTYRLEGDRWMIVSSTISIPYTLVQDGEVYPLRGLYERNRELEKLVEERTHELEMSNRKLQTLSNTDGLTGIANRRSFDLQLTQEWNHALRIGMPLSLIILDVDLFKHYNDHYGHLAGDVCLKTLAKALVHAERRSGRHVARYGGEEFVLLLPGAAQQETLETAKHIQQEIWALKLPHEFTEPGIVTVSLGVATIVPSRQYEPEELVRRADLALYRAKHLGRNCVQTPED